MCTRRIKYIYMYIYIYNAYIHIRLSVCLRVYACVSMWVDVLSNDAFMLFYVRFFLPLQQPQAQQSTQVPCIMTNAQVKMEKYHLHYEHSEKN